MPDACDVIVIGSGAAGAHAAYPLVQAGKRVLMLDVGYDAPPVMAQAPDVSFEEMRRRFDQHRWFLGEDLSNIPVQGLQGGLGGGMVSGNRSYVVRDVERLLPTTTAQAAIIQSLAKGGLGASWGAVCAYLPVSELADMGLSAQELARHYDIVTRRIGVSGPDAQPGMQPPLRLDHHAQRLLEAATRNQRRLVRMGMAVAQPPMAVLTRDLDSRRAYAYGEMEFYCDPARAVYRPQYTIDVLQRYANFTYASGRLVTRIIEDAQGSAVHAVLVRDGRPGAPEVVCAQRIILAGGAIGTARVLLAGGSHQGRSVPLIAKTHAFVACVHPRMFGEPGPAERLGLCQLMVMEQQQDGRCATNAQLYSYRSLLLFRLLSALPLPVPEALQLLSLWAPALIIADVRFATTQDAGGSLQLEQSSGAPTPRVHIRVELTAAEQRTRMVSLARMRRALHTLGLLPLRTLHLPEGSASHYAGTVPMTDAPSAQTLLSVDRAGKLHQGRRLYVADASVFRCLPSRPHTLTMMANANRVGEIVLQSLKSDAPVETSVRS